MNIGERIKQLRTELGLTQEDLATAAETTKSTIHKYETGIILNISAKKIKSIADKLSTTPDYLMGWTSENNPSFENKFNEIGERLRTLREQSNLTQEEVGNKIGVTKATVNRYETGEIDIKRTIAIKLAKVLDTTPSYIMGWEDSANISKTFPIIEKYNKLNDIGKNKTDAYIDGLLENPSYCKGSVKMVAEMPVSVPPKVIKKKRHT